MRSYETQYERVAKESARKEQLTTRRARLARMLESERDEYTEELTARVRARFPPAHTHARSHTSHVSCPCSDLDL